MGDADGSTGIWMIITYYIAVFAKMQFCNISVILFYAVGLLSLDRRAQNLVQMCSVVQKLRPRIWKS
jgi:hypothetical protein